MPTSNNETGLAVVLKGVTSGRDAQRAIDHGVDAVYVSNTGGRQLDHQPGTMDVLPEVVEAVAEKVEIIIDGGFMRSADVIKALALGATAVAIGRLQALALGAAGKHGLLRALTILEEELVINMGLLGVTQIDEIKTHHIRTVAPINSAHPLSPFPVVMERPRTGITGERIATRISADSDLAAHPSRPGCARPPPRTRSHPPIGTAEDILSRHHPFECFPGAPV